MKRLLALLLCLLMALSMIPAAAAEEIEIIEVDEEELEIPEDEELIDIIEPKTTFEPTGEPVTNGSCGENLTWSISSNGHGLVISGSGLMDDYGWSGAPWYDKRDQILYITVNQGVQSIGKNAFSNLRKVQSVSLPYGLEVIADDAFYECIELQSAELPLGLLAIGSHAFAYCYKLESVSFPATLQTIDGYAFTGCEMLQSVTIPASVTKINGGAFSCCDSLASINVNEGGSSYKSVNGVLFSADGMTLVCYPAGKGSSYTVPSGVKEIGDQAFYGCAALNSVKLPSGLTRIGGDALQGTGIATVTIPKKVTEIGNGAFRDCKSLTEILVDADSSSFKTVGGALLSKDGTEYLCYPGGLSASAYKIPSGVKKIRMFAFYYPNLGSVTIPASVTELETWAFISWESSTLKELVFQGSAPEFDAEGSLQGVGATVYYPAGDASWTEEVRGGPSLTWVAVNKAAITTQPKSKVADPDTTVRFSVTATGDDLSYQWQYRKSATGSWNNSSATGAKTATMSIKATEARNNFQFRCKVTNKLGTVYSSAATLGITGMMTSPQITTQPTSKTVNEGATAKFTVAATGAESYQWQYRKNSSDSWHNSTGTGNKTATLTTTATAARNGFQFRCKVSNAAGTTYSTSAKLTVVTKPVITTQPASKTVNEGMTAKFTVAATGATSYQWQYRKSATGTWYNSTGTGNKTATLSVEATEARNGFQFRCKVTNAAGTTYSGAATLTVLSKPTITTQPTSKTVTAGTTVKFKVAATGGGLSYQWQYRKSSSDSWHNCTSTGAQTATLTISATAARNGFQFRCKVTNAAGTTYSSYARLTVK